MVGSDQLSAGASGKTVAFIPAYNEARHIGVVAAKASRYVDQVIVIDDGSTDGTAATAAAAGALVISHDRNLGKGTALNTAFKAAGKIRPAALVVLDGDGQHDPKEIPLLLEPVLQDRADLVVGSRFLAANRIPKYRILGQHLLTLVTNWGSGIRLTDSQSGYRAFSPRAVAQLCFSARGFSVESEMQFLARAKGLRVVEVPVLVHYGRKAKRNPVVHGLGVMGGIVRMVLKMRGQGFMK